MYTIYNNIGQAVLSGQVKEEHTLIKLGDLSGGIYTVKIQTLDGIATSRFVKE